MSEKRDASTYTDFDELMDRLDAIVGAVRAKDVTIEESLDLLEEGIELGLRATDLVEKPDFTLRERKALDEAEASGALEVDAEGTVEAGESGSEPGADTAPSDDEG